MALINLVFIDSVFFWDGRSFTLEDQALLPIEAHDELNDSWENEEEKLRRHPDYPKRFRSAFGIDLTSEITRELAVKAIAQFERILISSGNSLYDRAIRGEYFFSDAELNGYQMFFDIGSGLPDAECGHCHNIPLFTTNEYTNNGLQEAATLEDFKDKGHGLITGDPFANGTFRIPTLRNITKSAPYMHDGSLATLEEVIEHYNSGGTCPSALPRRTSATYSPFSKCWKIPTSTKTPLTPRPSIKPNGSISSLATNIFFSNIFSTRKLVCLLSDSC